MQLAATQRAAHPPPVPPRPNRQALVQPGTASKKRPPCPTRQAPPPPSNARPWNHSNHNHANNINNNNNVISNGLTNGCGPKKQLEVRFDDSVVVKVQEDQDPNIKRQDWLEAGVRYSSTKITLPATVNGDSCEKVGTNGVFLEEEKKESEEVAVVEAAAAEEDAEEKEDEGGGEGGGGGGEEEEATAAENQLEFSDLDFSR